MNVKGPNMFTQMERSLFFNPRYCFHSNSVALLRGMHGYRRIPYLISRNLWTDLLDVSDRLRGFFRPYCMKFSIKSMFLGLVTTH